MDDLGGNPAVQQRRLREALQNARAELRLTQAEVARRLGWSSSKLLRVENGKNSVSTDDLIELLSLYGITDPAQRKELTVAARVAARVNRAPAAPGITPEYQKYLEYEKSATTIKSFEMVVVPGLAQRYDYAFAVVRGLSRATDSNADVEQRVAVRAYRQQILERKSPPRVHLLMDESAIHRLVGGRDVMAEQLEWLSELNRRENVTIQIVPYANGVHVGLCGPFTVLEFNGADEPPILYKEHALSDHLNRNDAEEIRQYRAHFDALAANATPPDQLDRVLQEAIAAMTPFRVRRPWAEAPASAVE